ncbi:hypothetical protein NIES22_11180 [Calothrix brevissima NIES-22]|nr:hypothetical protein NIES22_11180 [Calothrix brevissima NIES-22]
MSHLVTYLLNNRCVDRAFIFCADGNNDGYRAITSFVKVYYEKLRKIADRP